MPTTPAPAGPGPATQPFSTRTVGEQSVATPDLGEGERDPDDAERCLLDGCDLPLPARALDESGRPKGGRRPQYCSKAHADAASRQRRAREVAAVADPLTLARDAGETFLPAARQLGAHLDALITRFDQAEAGALGRVRAAEQENARAQDDASAAREAADTAEVARRQALAQARADRQARDNAVREAERARQDADQARTAAWDQVAVHERARGQAEAAATAAETAADTLAGQNRQLRDQTDLARATLTQLTAQLAAADRELERSRGESLALLARIEAVERIAALDGERLRAELATAATRTAELSTDLAARQDQARTADQAHAQTRRNLTEAHDRLAEQERRLAQQQQAHAEELAAERAAHRLDQDLLAAARRSLRAHAKRRPSPQPAPPHSPPTER